MSSPFNTTSLLIPSLAPISFFWSGSNINTTDLPQCSNFTVTTLLNSVSAVQPVTPLYFLVAAVNGSVESFITQGNNVANITYNWTVNFPVGQSLYLAMSDSGNNSGGAVGPFTVVPGTTNCLFPTSTPILSAVYDPPDNPCDEIDIFIAGGFAPPYTVTLLSPKLGRYSNLTTSNNPIRFGNNLNAGAPFTLFITDSAGFTSAVSDDMTSAYGQSSCTKPTSQQTPPSNSLPSHSLAEIVGGAVGGVLGSIILLAIIYFYYRRKKAIEAAERHLQESKNNNSDEFTMENGDRPLVTPFVLPSTSRGVESFSNHAYAGLAPIRSNNLYYGDENSPNSSQGGQISGHYIPITSASPHSSNAQYRYSPTSTSYPILPHPPNPNPSNPNLNYNNGNSSNSSNSPYSNYNNGALPPLPVDSNTGLANPNDFEYRN